MANTALVQIRTAEEDKRQASEILERLGTNLSAVFNMMLKQIILTESIPFEISLHPEKSVSDANVNAVAATMRIENMELDEEEMAMLRFYQKNPDAGDTLRKQIIESLGEGHE